MRSCAAARRPAVTSPYPCACQSFPAPGHNAHARCTDTQLGHAHKSRKADEKTQTVSENWNFEGKTSNWTETRKIWVPCSWISQMEICSASLEKNWPQKTLWIFRPPEWREPFETIIAAFGSPPPSTQCPMPSR